MEEKYTPFSFVYDSFLAKITDDMYMELTETDTYSMLEELLVNAIPKFEFPRVQLNSYVKGYLEYDGIYNGVDSEGYDAVIMLCKPGHFNFELTQEEINILAVYMIVEWLSQQLASVENTRMKYAGSDFKFTSQANHMHKILQLKKDYEREGFHLQRLYSRRKKGKDGNYKSTFSDMVQPREEI